MTKKAWWLLLLLLVLFWNHKGTHLQGLGVCVRVIVRLELVALYRGVIRIQYIVASMDASYHILHASLHEGIYLVCPCLCRGLP